MTDDVFDKRFDKATPITDEWDDNARNMGRTHFLFSARCDFGSSRYNGHVAPSLPFRFSLGSLILSVIYPILVPVNFSSVTRLLAFNVTPLSSDAIGFTIPFRQRYYEGKKYPYSSVTVQFRSVFAIVVAFTTDVASIRSRELERRPNEFPKEFLVWLVFSYLFHRYYWMTN